LNFSAKLRKRSEELIPTSLIIIIMRAYWVARLNSPIFRGHKWYKMVQPKPGSWVQQTTITYQIG
jgi:hypothetical protein